jgi:hypothetical protein
MMTKNEILYGLSWLLLFNCTSPRQESKMKNDVLDFLDAKEYRFSTNKLDVPSIALDSVSKINGEAFLIGDSTDAGKINLSDSHLFTSDGKDRYPYRRKLHFVLVGDSTCLLVYTEGGFGTHDVIDYLQYKGQYSHLRYETTDILDDTVKLRQYLQRNPPHVK